MLQGHSMKPKHGARRKRDALGRGSSSGSGTTAGRGTKGQRARSGSRKGLMLFGSKTLIQSIPKLRGFKSMAKKPVSITLQQLQKHFADGTIVTTAELVKVSLIKTEKTPLKIVGNVKVEKKLTLQNLAVSAGAKSAIEAAGGTVNN